MKPAELIEALQDPTVFPDGAREVEVRQTHCSMVFLVGDHAYKIKKPVDLGFLDFSTLEKRREACEAEARLNRRLSPDVYQDVVPLTRDAEGLRVGGKGEVVDWVVPMRRLPDDATFLALLEAERLTPGHLEALARRMARFFSEVSAEEAEHEAAGFERVAAHLRGAIDTLPGWVGDDLAPELVERLQAAVEARLAADEATVRSRAAAGVGREGHGDLRLDHVYWLGEDDPHGPLRVIDGVEFSHELRSGDPLQDIAFLVMELEYQGHAALGRAFAEAYLDAAGDPGGLALLPLYVGYRHAVRGKVRWLESLEDEVPEEARRAARARARRHLLGVLGSLAPPDQRPALVLVGGLPGSGKSSVGRALTERGFTRVSTDGVRRELAGLGPTEPTPPERKGEIYSPEFNERTYAEVMRRVEAALWRGERAVMDATFTLRKRRHAGLDLANRLGVPSLFLHVRTSDAVTRERLAARQGDESDAGVEVYELLLSAWEEDDERTAAARVAVDNDGTPTETLDQLERALRDAGLAGEARSTLEE
jgi:aminoglycoside phosphotransferase family enzyme/predicted kinase